MNAWNPLRRLGRPDLHWLYIVATVLLLLPLWAVRRVPTVDGPSHLYNAFVMRHLHDPAFPLFAQHFQVDLQPLPNWLIQALLYGLLGVAPPAVAEKLLLSAYVVLFAGAAWWFAGSQARGRRANAFLALPFAYNLLFHFGFYNFILSLPLFLLAVGWWWRGRDAPTWRWALALHGLLLLCYFAHIVSLVMAGLTIAVLWTASFDPARWRRWLLQPLLLLPQLALPFWFVTTHGSTPLASTWTFSQSWRYLLEQRVLFVFRAGHGPGRGLTLLFLLLVVATLVSTAWRRATLRDHAARHAFLLAAVAATLLYFVAPAGMAGGGILEPRLALYPFLLLLPWLDFRFDRDEQARKAPLITGITAGVALLVTGLLFWESAALVRWQRQAARGVDELLAGHAAVGTDRRVLDIIFDRYASLDNEVLGHAVGRVAIDKGLIDWDDYHATSPLFPLRFRPGVVRPRDFEPASDNFAVERYAPIVDVIYTWAMPAQSPLRTRLEATYERVGGNGRGELWQRRGR